MSGPPVLTILIPTYNRPGLLRRVLSYYGAQTTRWPLMVADSSSSPASEANAGVVALLADDLEIRLLNFPPSIRLEDKLQQALQAVPTPYVALCGDDDFVLPGPLGRAADFLAAHPDFALAHGRAYSVLFGRLGPVVTPYHQRSVLADHPADRLTDHLSHYATTFYSVHITEQAAAIYAAAVSVTRDAIFAELLTSCLSILDGKAMCLPELYMVRQATPGTTGTVLGTARLLADPEYAERYAAFRGALASALAPSLDPAAAARLVDGAFQAYLAAVTRPPQPPGPVELLAGRAARLAALLPRALRALSTGGGLPALLRDPAAWLGQLSFARQVDQFMGTRPEELAAFQSAYQLLAAYPAGMPSDLDLGPGGGGVYAGKVSESHDAAP